MLCLWEQSANSLPYSHPDWLQAVASNRWKVLIPKNKNWYLPIAFRMPFYIERLPFTPQSGPVGLINQDELLVLFKFLSKNCLFGKMGFELLPVTYPNGYTNNGITHHLRLQNLKLQKNHQRNLTIAQKHGVICKPITGAIHHQFFEKHFAERNEKLSTKYIKFVKNIFEIKNPDLVWLHEGAFVEQQLIAAASWLRCKNTDYYLLATTNQDARKCGAAFALVHQHATNALIKIEKIDFEGSKNQGVARFYQGFGAQKVVYPTFNADIYQTFLAWLNH